jgi:hypothetical protein
VRHTAPAALACLAASLAGAQDLVAEDLSAAGLARVALETTRDTYFVGEPFEVRVAFELEREFLTTRLVQLFQRALDVPVQVSAPFLELEGLRRYPGQGDARGASFALGEQIERAARLPERSLDEHAMAPFVWTVRVAATQVGELLLPAPSMRLAYATRFEDDFLQGRKAVDRRDGRVRGRERRLTILALPEEGRPLDFSGAVGPFTLAATLEPSELALGEHCRLTLRIRAAASESSLDFEPPRLDDLAAFALTGQQVERAGGVLEARYDLVLRSAAAEFPAIPFSFFELTPPAGYRVAHSLPIPLVTRNTPAEAAAELDAQPKPTAPASGRGAMIGLLGGAGLLAAVLVAALAWRLARRARAK